MCIAPRPVGSYILKVVFLAAQIMPTFCDLTTRIYLVCGRLFLSHDCIFYSFQYDFIFCRYLFRILCSVGSPMQSFSPVIGCYFLVPLDDLFIKLFAYFNLLMLNQYSACFFFNKFPYKPREVILTI